MEYYILIGETQKGPFSAEELREQVGKGELNGRELAWHEGLAEWQPLRAILLPVSAPQAAPSLAPLSPTQPAWLHDRKVIVPLVVVSMLVFFPVGIALVLLSKAFRRRAKIIMVSIVPALLLGLILLVLIVGSIQRNAFAEDRDGIMSATQAAIANGDTTTLAKIIAKYSLVTDSEFAPLLKQAQEMVTQAKESKSRAVAETEPLEYKLACIDAGHRLSKTAPQLREYKRILAELSERFETTPARIGDMTSVAVKELHDQQIQTTMLEMMLAAEKATSKDSAQMVGKGDHGYSSTLALLAVLMIDAKEK